MSIWNYNDMPWPIDESVCASEICVFCRVALKTHSMYPDGIDGNRSLSIKHCLLCGWWTGEYIFDDNEWIGRRITTTYYNYAYGILKSLDVKDLKNPINEVRDFLTVRYEKIKHIHPRLMEEVVGSVFEGLGYYALVTNFSGDFGIDVILHDASSNLIGVQVRRYNSKIKAEQIRELTGALVQGGYTKGVFVTTSDFQSGAIKSAARSTSVGVPIELINYQKFFDALKISQANTAREEISFQNYDVKKFRLHSYHTMEDDDRYFE